MRSAPLTCVVDASVGIKLFVAEALSDRATALFAHLAANPPANFYVPDLFFIECTNILRKHVIRFGYPPDKAQKDLIHLRALDLNGIPTADLIKDALHLALIHPISAYDASYVALAQRFGIPLVTADEKLVRALAGTSYSVHSLKTFPIPALL